MNQELVSVIVPVYNTAEYIKECIQSILSQSYKNIELILVNDGSTDISGEICKKYENMPNVIYIEQDNSGTQASRENGVKAAKGEWIMFVDSDDYLLKNGIDDLYALTDGVDIVVGCHTRSEKLKDAPSHLEKEDYLYALYCRRIPFEPWAKLFRKELFCYCPMAFVYKIPIGEDHIMNLALARVNKKKVAVCKKPVYFHRERLGSAYHSYSYELDYGYNLCNILDSVVAGGMQKKNMNQGKIINRLCYYLKFLNRHRLQGNKSHPLVRDIIRLMNNDKCIRLSDRLILYVSDRRAMKFCFFLRKFIVRIEQPSLIIRDIKRLLFYRFEP